MEYFVICLAALVGAGMSLVSGFGLGTLLVPVFGIFFPIEIAITLTAIVHFLNNIFKLGLLGRHADWGVVLRFGIPAIGAAFLGAYLLTFLTELKPVFSYTLGSKVFTVLPVKFVIAIVLMFFALFEGLPRFSKVAFDQRYLSLGGILSGFFGGLSGNQGAFRSAFLIRANLSKEAFIASGIVVSCMIDISRLSLYTKKMIANHEHLDWQLVAVATLSAFLGAYLGSKLIQKITILVIQKFIAIMLFVFSILLMGGII